MKRTLVALAAIALGACAAPSSFEGLTGGIKMDDSLGAPRPMSPISVSMVATSRPKLKWQLSGSLTGAVVEMSRSRDFLPERTKTFTAIGSELVVPEDLEPGIWFWRLAGTTPSARGSTTSAIWEVLVRGPAKFGSSDAPSGSVVDINGDGIPDLLTVGETPEQGELLTLPFEMRGNEKGELAEFTETMSFPLTWAPKGKPPNPISIAAGTDLDGDGFSDFAFASYDDMTEGSGDPNGIFPWVATIPGSPKGIDYARVNDPLVGLVPGTTPTLASAGDVDGDGFGDLLVGGGQVSFVTRGGALGPAASAAVFPVFDYPPLLTEGRAVLGGFDADGDGIADIAAAQPKLDVKQWRNGFATSPNALGATKNLHTGSTFTSGGNKELGGELAGNEAYPPPDFRRAVQLSSGVARISANTKVLSVSRAPADGATAKAMTSGDFNGDGLADVATIMIEAGFARVCVYFGNREQLLVDGGCLDPVSGDALGIDGITTGDLEGDGQDELLVAAAGTIRAVHFDQQGGRHVDVIAEVTRTQGITTVWPGRPGKARWAVSDGATISVYEGTAVKQTIARPSYITRGFGRVMR